MINILTKNFFIYLIISIVLVYLIIILFLILKFFLFKFLYIKILDFHIGRAKSYGLINMAWFCMSFILSYLLIILIFLYRGFKINTFKPIYKFKFNYLEKFLFLVSFFLTQLIVIFFLHEYSYFSIVWKHDSFIVSHPYPLPSSSIGNLLENIHLYNYLLPEKKNILLIKYFLLVDIALFFSEVILRINIIYFLVYYLFYFISLSILLLLFFWNKICNIRISKTMNNGINFFWKRKIK